MLQPIQPIKKLNALLSRIAKQPMLKHDLDIHILIVECRETGFPQCLSLKFMQEANFITLQNKTELFRAIGAFLRELPILKIEFDAFSANESKEESAFVFNYLRTPTLTPDEWIGDLINAIQETSVQEIVFPPLRFPLTEQNPLMLAYDRYIIANRSHKRKSKFAAAQ